MKYTAKAGENPPKNGWGHKIEIPDDEMIDSVIFEIVVDGQKIQLVADNYVLYYTEYDDPPVTEQFETLADLEKRLAQFGNSIGSHCNIWYFGVEQNSKEIYKTARVKWLTSDLERLEKQKTELKNTYELEMGRIQRAIELRTKELETYK